MSPVMTPQRPDLFSRWIDPLETPVGCVTRYAQVEPTPDHQPWVTAQAALSTGTPQPRLASRRVPRLTFSHLVSYPPYERTGQTNTEPPAVGNELPTLRRCR